jgi:hypothetical protein
MHICPITLNFLKIFQLPKDGTLSPAAFPRNMPRGKLSKFAPRPSLEGLPDLHIRLSDYHIPPTTGPIKRTVNPRPKVSATAAGKNQ